MAWSRASLDNWYRGACSGGRRFSNFPHILRIFGISWRLNRQVLLKFCCFAAQKWLGANAYHFGTSLFPCIIISARHSHHEFECGRYEKFKTSWNNIQPAIELLLRTNMGTPYTLPTPKLAKNDRVEWNGGSLLSTVPTTIHIEIYSQSAWVELVWPLLCNELCSLSALGVAETNQEQGNWSDKGLSTTTTREYTDDHHIMLQSRRWLTSSWPRGTYQGRHSIPAFGQTTIWKLGLCPCPNSKSYPSQGLGDAQPGNST